jgi:hypothetical protein
MGEFNAKSFIQNTFKTFTRTIEMISTSQAIQIQRFANALYGLQVGKQTLAVVEQELANAGGVLPTVLNTYYGRSFASLSLEQVASGLVTRLGITAAGSSIAKDYVIGQLASTPKAEHGTKVAEILALYSSLGADPIFGASVRAWNAQVDAALAYSGTENIFSAGGRVFSGFSPFDAVTGTELDDLLITTLTTAVSTGVMDGKAGQDRLEILAQNLTVDVARRGEASFVAQNIETIQVKSEFASSLANTQGTAQSSGSQLNAQRVSGANSWENQGSTDDLIIEDVRLLDNQITKDVTITMRDTAAGHVDYGVYFDQNALRSSASTTEIRLEVMDTSSAAAGFAPLRGSPYGGFGFTVTDKNSGISKSILLQSAAINDAQTYAELAAAYQKALDAALGVGAISVSVGSDFTVIDKNSRTPVTGQQINLTATGSLALTTPAGSGFLSNAIVPPDSFHTNFISGSPSRELITSKIILDSVGRGSTGGDLVVGGQLVGDTSTSKGVQRFEIEVQDNSKLQTISSTNNSLSEVVLFNRGDDPNTQHAGHISVLGRMASANPADDDAALPGAAAQHGAFGFSDLNVIDGSAMKGSIEYTSQIRAASVAKYLFNLGNPDALYRIDNVIFSYLGGRNKDKLSTTMDAAVVSAILTSLAGDAFKFTMDGGAGDDSLTVTIGSPAATGWAVDQKMFRYFSANSEGPRGTGQWVSNLNLLGGEGNDTIAKPTAGDFLINGGAGNDTILTDNTGATKSEWQVSATDATGTIRVPVNNSPFFLYKGKLTVAYSAANGATFAIAGADADAPVDVVGGDANLTNGWEVTVDIGTIEGRNTAWAVDQFTINQAIKRAINLDPVLGKLLLAADGPGNVLTVTSLLDGAHVVGDLDFKISAPTTSSATGDFNVLTTADATAAQIAYVEFTRTNAVVGNPATWDLANAATIADVDARLGAQLSFTAGTNSTVDTDNIIEGGAGNDVIALSSNATSQEVLLYKGFENGKDSVVNFTAVAGAGQDSIDFRSYLDGKVNVSAISRFTESRISTTLNADATVELNSVTILAPGAFNKNLIAGGDASPAGAANTLGDTFAGLTAAKFLAAINSTNTGSADYAGITAATLNAGISLTADTHVSATLFAAQTVIGTTGKAVVMVENDDNLGEYAIFELSWSNVATNTARDFNAAKLIGIVDFGNTIVGSVDNYSTGGTIDGLFL